MSISSTKMDECWDNVAHAHVEQPRLTHGGGICSGIVVIVCACATNKESNPIGTLI